MRIQSLLLADALVSSPDGKMAILGAGIDRIAATQFPWAQAQISVFVGMRGESEADAVGTQHDLRIRVIAPGGDVVAELGGPFAVSSPYAEADPLTSVQNAGLVFQQVQFPEPGIYSVVAVLDDHEESVPLSVLAAPPVQAQWIPAPTAAIPTS